MSYEEASERETGAFHELQRAISQRGHVNPKAAIFSDHAAYYEAAVQALLAAVQAYEAATTDLILEARAKPHS